MSSGSIKTIQNSDGVVLNNKEAANCINGYYAHIGQHLALSDWKPHGNFPKNYRKKEEKNSKNI